MEKRRKFLLCNNKIVSIYSYSSVKILAQIQKIAFCLVFYYHAYSIVHRSCIEYVCRKTHLLHLLKKYVQFISDIILQRETLNENCSCKVVSMFAWCILYLK